MLYCVRLQLACALVAAEVMAQELEEGLVEELVALVEQEGPQDKHGGLLQLPHSEYSTLLSSYHPPHDHTLR